MLIFLMVVAVAAAGCRNQNRENELVIEYGSPPRFVVSGPNAVQNFRISGPDLQRETNPDGSGDHLMAMKVYWEIVPTGSATNRKLDEIAHFTYGQLPEGFVQISPANGASPPSLVEGHKYALTLTPAEGRWVNMFFLIRDGKIVPEKEE
jgi:hypothetical protein